jgi:uncharacterized small protein (DUF1192 family)
MDWYEDSRPLRRRYQRSGGLERAMEVDELEARLDALLGEIRRVEAELTSLRGPDENGAGSA